LEELKRAADIFKSFAEGGDEHQATLALLAEAQNRTGRYPAAAETLRQLEAFHPPSATDPASTGLLLARAKVLWYNGDAKDAKYVCEAVLELDHEDGRIDGLNPIHAAAARTGQALSQLLLASDTLDDAFTIRDPFRMALRTLELGVGTLGSPASGAAPTFYSYLALAHLNYGIAEAVYSRIVEKKNQVEVPIDAALRSWRQGLTTIKRWPSHHEPALRAAVEARLLTNLSWGLLQHNGNNSDTASVERASEFAGQALKLYDLPRHSEWDKTGLGRTLSILASCYHRLGAAVTSEGLFQSAIDKDDDRGDRPDASPLRKVELAASCSRYADLCRDWDRRGGDARNLDQRAARIRGSLPPLWRSKPGICGSLWFWTPSLP
jgi:tetratricopeptide (TPR) repeat protein